MVTNLTLDQAAEILRGAFKPLHCGVEGFDYGQKVKFRVFDANDAPLLSMIEMKASQAQNPHDLKNAIQNA